MSALERLRRWSAAVWIAVVALLAQAFIPALHDAHDIADAFATAHRHAHAADDTAHLALLLLERHQHGEATPAVAHEHGNAAHKSPSDTDRQSGDDSGTPPCPVWQAAQGSGHFVSPALPALSLPALLPAELEAPRLLAAERELYLPHPPSRAPPRQA